MNFSELASKISEWYENKDPDTQKKISTLLLVGSLCIVVMIFVFLANDKKEEKRPQQSNKKEIKTLSPRLGMLEKSLYYETSQKVKDMEQKLNQIQLSMKAVQAQMRSESKTQYQSTQKELEKLKKELEAQKKKGQVNPALEKHVKKLESQMSHKGVSPKYPPPVSPQKHTIKDKQVHKVIGELGHADQVSSLETTPEKKPEEPKEKKETIYLPPSLLSADLLSGFDAPTMSAGKSEPIKAVLRIRDLAILPNDIKSDLKGCFVIAEGYGNLADERAHLRLLRLSCVARNGRSVIDEKITGFVEDEDGRIGLRGIVITKAAALLARTVFARFLEGFGEAYEASSYDVTNTAAGQLYTLDPTQAVEAGIGKGISKGAERYSKFMLDMAEQCMPVIEIGSGKRVTMIIDQGKDIELKTKCLGSKDGCQDYNDGGSSIYVLSNL